MTASDSEHSYIVRIFEDGRFERLPEAERSPAGLAAYFARQRELDAAEMADREHQQMLHDALVRLEMSQRETSSQRAAALIAQTSIHDRLLWELSSQQRGRAAEIEPFIREWLEKVQDGTATGKDTQVMARKVRAERTKASQKALAAKEPRAAARALGKARATGRTFPTSGQRERSKKD